jgi:hypothetical protein
MFYNTPRLPKALLHPLLVVQRTSERGPGGQSRPVEETVASFQGVVMPLSNLDWKQLPEGTYTQNSQKLYTDDPVVIKPGQIIRDTYDGQQYTVKQKLSHNSIHPMHRYLVEGVDKT